MRRLLGRMGRGVLSPTAQVLAATAGMLAGATIVGRLAVGFTVLGLSLLAAADGLLRDPDRRNRPALRPVSTHEEVLARYRASR